MSLYAELDAAEQRRDQCRETLRLAELAVAQAAAAVELEERRTEVDKAAKAGKVVAVPAANRAVLSRPVLSTVAVDVVFTPTRDNTSMCITDCEIDRLFWVFQDQYDGACLFMEPGDPIGLSEADLQLLRNIYFGTGKAHRTITFCISYAFTTSSMVRYPSPTVPRS
jgi:hypothetical protein